MKKVIYTFGDNINYGAGEDKSLIDIFAQEADYQAKKFSVKGATLRNYPETPSVIKDQITKSDAPPPDLIILAGGLNDLAKIRSVFDLEFVLLALKETLLTVKQKWPETPIYFTLPNEISSLDGYFQRLFAQQATKLAARIHIGLLDLYHGGRTPLFDGHNL